ncbi:DNA mismatch repair protein [Vibrio sp. 99-70-13A1]|uniref:DNA mismatch repair protein n=1 Tax=Vibrio sp. 99-70-13A1 TaxID=2607601 RepID=UPI001493608D|nr:DNA mismatch repair protein [Vibrio sp. 99-70-13A1]NOH96014.1 DNA mismatch repair protein [Vibrio sp. 99-70-13A1]
MALRLPPAWMIVLSGLVLNIMAIVLSSLVLDELVSEQAAFGEQKSSNVYSIQLAWNSIETLERKRESILLHLDRSPIQPLNSPSSLYTSPLRPSPLSDALQGQLSVWVGGNVPAIEISNLSEIMMLINTAQQTERTRIDDYYLENLGLSETMQLLDDKMAFYKNIALFLQIFGLALILARDLARKS